MYEDNLIFGKNKETHIVAIECDDSYIEVFKEKDGVISNEWYPNTYWIVSDIPHYKDWKRLDGDQHYKWGKTYDNFNDYIKDRNWLKKKQADVYSIFNDKEAIQVLDGYTYFKGMKLEDVSVLAFDIETVGLTHDSNSKVLLISNTYKSQGKTIRKLFAYDDYSTQKELIEDWCLWVRTINPSVIVGHNIFGYDFPYLHFVASLHNTTLCLGRDDSDIKFDKWESKFRVDGSKDLHYHRAHIYGRNIIDTLFLSYKYDIGRNYENYKLKYIVEKEGLQVKDRQFYDGSKIKDNYQNKEEWLKIKKYAEHDADDALSLYNLMIPSLFYFTQAIPKTFQQIGYTATGSQLNSLLVRSYLQEGHSIAKASESAPFEGAISFAVPGIYKNVYKLDIKAMYPSIMLSYKIYDKIKDPKQNFYNMVKYFTNERLKNKKLAKETKEQYYTDLEQSGKIAINSAYGLLGAPGLNYNSGSNASLVTKKGREILQKAIYWATSKEYNYWKTLFEERTS